jgi:hypothetical protein
MARLPGTGFLLLGAVLGEFYRLQLRLPLGVTALAPAHFKKSRLPAPGSPTLVKTHTSNLFCFRYGMDPRQQRLMYNTRGYGQ